MQTHNQAAPGALELVRRFLNTWSIPNQTRVEVDNLPVLARDADKWREELSLHPRAESDTLERLSELRSDLRKSCEGLDDDHQLLNAWLARVALSVKAVAAEGGAPGLCVTSADTSYVASILALVANAISSGTWSRLKTCDDCRWAFYDHTRNGSKRWCGMTKGGVDGRACGTIAKVSAFRARAAAKKSPITDGG
ncbi:CGNR zinc finger domain-containing protein [Pseudomonas sp. KU26590]|uniref:CGNR zinc finger domain-containing protein n=1 Tax=Pseudomonas sp. KU26590 TaxID=2991051 RepID=UPI00223DC8AA|nr:CGNR zinc finger domain-containing protein [Pseudomonas sp. KU26590]UZJ58025.1 CGNR zinc finger domain-containing protein [Pseudomonas sp. KU26590]